MKNDTTGPGNFIQRDVFNDVIGKINRQDGEHYQDIDTIYGDMSRLVVAWLANSDPKDLRSLYNELNWGGSANARAIHEAAKRWMQDHHAHRLVANQVWELRSQKTNAKPNHDLL